MKPLVQTVAVFGCVWLASALSGCSGAPTESERAPQGVPIFRARVERYRNLDGTVWECKTYPIRNLDGVVIRLDEICE